MCKCNCVHTHLVLTVFHHSDFFVANKSQPAGGWSCNSGENLERDGAYPPSISQVITEHLLGARHWASCLHHSGGF